MGGAERGWWLHIGGEEVIDVVVNKLNVFEGSFNDIKRMLSKIVHTTGMDKAIKTCSLDHDIDSSTASSTA